MPPPGLEPHKYEKKVICVGDSKDAIKVTPIHPHKPTPFWVPKSVIHDDSEVYEKGNEGTLIVFEWFALKENWE